MPIDMDQFEDEVMRMLLDKDEPMFEVLRQQYRLATKKPRDMTGVGFYTEFNVPEEAPRLPGNPSLVLGGVLAEIEGLECGVGFALFIGEGILTLLEGYTYEEPWPDEPTHFTLNHYVPWEERSEGKGT